MINAWHKGSKNACPDQAGKNISEIEKIIGVKLPEDYVKVSKEYNGLRPVPSEINVGKRSTSINFLLTLEVGNNVSSDSLLFSYRHNDDRGNLIVPFAATGGASRFCFDYRASLSNPTIVFDNADFEADDPNAITLVADSFTNFLEMLYDE